MALSFLSRKARVATITIEEDAIRHIDLKSHSPLQLNCAGEMALPAGIVKTGKSSMWKRWNRCSIRLSISGVSLRSQSASSPLTNSLSSAKYHTPKMLKPVNWKAISSLKLVQRFTCLPEDPVFDVVPYHVDGDNPEVIIIASKESVIEDYESVLNHAKLKALVADLENGYVSIVPIQFDMTAHHTIQQLNTWNLKWKKLIYL